MRFTRRGYGRLLRDDGTEVSRHVVPEEAYESAARAGPGSYTWQPAPISVLVEPHDCETPAPAPEPAHAPAPVPSPAPAPEPAPSLPDLVPGGTARLPTTVVLTMQDGLAPGRERVTFGLPLSVGVLTDPAQLRATIAGIEVPIAVRPGLRWHWRDGSLRSVTVQMEVDLSAGDRVVELDAAGGSLRMSGWPVLDGWTPSGHTDADGRALLMPRVVPLHDPDYLAACGLLPPFAPPPQDDAAATGIWGSLTATHAGHGLLDAAFPWARTATGGIDFDSWLFDRPGTLFKLSMQFRDAEKRRALLRNAALSKRHYFAQVVETQQDSRPTQRIPYWWDLKRKAEGSAFSYSTTMYQQCQGAKLALALLGDDTQWTDDMLLRWAADIRGAQGSPGMDVLTLAETYRYPAGWTERLAGIPSLFHLHAWEITGDATLRASLDQRVAYLRRMQQEHRDYEIAEGWPASSGVFRHSWIGHGGAGEAPNYMGVLQETYPAGTQTVRIRFRLSDRDVQRWANKGFYIGGNGAFMPTDYQRQDDGTWLVTLDKPLKATAGPGADISARTNIHEAPLVEADQGFSPWMSVYIADYLWQQYTLLGTPEIPEMLRRLGNAINERGFLSVPNDDGTFTRDIWTYPAKPGRGFNRDTDASYPLYLASDLAPREVLFHGGFMDTHTEVFFPVALALLFESDPVRRRRLRARCERVEYALFHEKAIFAPNPRRQINWQHSASPLRTWRWVAART